MQPKSEREALAFPFISDIPASRKIAGIGKELGTTPGPRLTLAHATDKARRIAGFRLRTVEMWRQCVADRKPGMSVVELTGLFVDAWNASKPSVPLSRTTLYRWRETYARTGIVGLVDCRCLGRHAASRRKQIPEPFWRAFCRYWLHRSKPSVQLAWQLALADCTTESRQAWAREYSVGLFRSRVAKLPELLVVLGRRPDGWPQIVTEYARSGQLQTTIQRWANRGGKR